MDGLLKFGESEQKELVYHEKQSGYSLLSSRDLCFMANRMDTLYIRRRSKSWPSEKKREKKANLGLEWSDVRSGSASAAAGQQLFYFGHKLRLNSSIALVSSSIFFLKSK